MFTWSATSRNRATRSSSSSARVDGIDIADADALTDAVVAAKPEAVYHLAGAADVGGSWAAPRETFLANALGTLNVLEASREAGAERVLAVTSADVYGRVTEDELPLDEDQPAAARVAVRRVQGGGRRPRPAGLARATGCRSSGCGPSTTSAPARATASSPRRWPPASPATSATAATRCPSAT